MTNYTPLEWLLLVLAVLGGIDLAARGLGLLTAAFPRFYSAQRKIWHLFADAVAVPALRRKAVAARVEEVVNQSAFELQQYLPKGWVKRARIRWVRTPAAAELRDGQFVLRVRPAKDIDQSMMNALWTYFGGCIFPNCRDLVPSELISASALAITRAGLERHHPYLLGEFDKTFVKSVTSGNQVLIDTFADCVRLNDFGLLMGPFLREVELAATGTRFSPGRVHFTETVKKIREHMLGFQPLLRLPHKPDSEWMYQDDCSSYAFILVSKPLDLRPGINAYVARAQDKVRRGVSRLYVIGRYEEREFVFSVIRAMLAVRELKGVELFSLFRDYRGDQGGVGALLGLDQMLAALKAVPRAVEALAPTPEESPVASAADAETGAMAADADEDLAQIAEDLVVQLSDYDGAWIHLAEFGLALRRQVPGFTPQRYGGHNLLSVLKRLNFLEFDERGAGPAKVVLVRRRAGMPSAAPGKVRPVTASLSNDAVRARVVAIANANGGDEGWMFLGRLGHLLKVEIPGFDPVILGASSLHELVRGIPELELEERGEGHAKTYVRVRRQS